MHHACARTHTYTHTHTHTHLQRAIDTHTYTHTHTIYIYICIGVHSLQRRWSRKGQDVPGVTSRAALLLPNSISHSHTHTHTHTHLYLVAYTVAVLRYSAEIAVAYNNTGGSPHGVAQRDAGQTEIINTCAMRYTAVFTRFRCVVVHGMYANTK